MIRAFFLAVVCVLAALVNASAVTVESLQSRTLPDRVQITIDLSEPIQFQQFSLANPARIVLDFPNSIKSTPAKLAIEQGAVALVRTGYRRAGLVRIVVDLRYPARANIHLVRAVRGSGQRILLDVYNRGSNDVANDGYPLVTLDDRPLPNQARVADKRATSLPRRQERQKPITVQTAQPRQLPSMPDLDLESVTTTTAPDAPLVDRSEVSLPAPVSMKNKITIRRSVSTPPNIPTPPPVKIRKVVPSVAQDNSRDIVIAIDPGHGGRDPGAHSRATGLKEKNVVLQIARRLKRDLDAKPGFRAVMTRNSDIYIPLRRRMQIARHHNADLFVSIHADAVKSTTPQGSSVYILSTRGASSQLAKYLANQENAVDLRWGVDVSKYDDDIQEALLNIQQEATLESSDILAKKTLQELAKIGNIHRSSVERANFVVLRSPEIPSMLVETAFISNPEEARLLATPSYQEKIARGVANGIEAYFREHLPQHVLLNAK